jgi:serine/threonine protein kinase
MEFTKDGFRAGVILNGRYRSVEPLNSGSFGLVFSAKDLIKGEIVAIKCILKKHLTEDEALFGDLTNYLNIDLESEELRLHSELGSHPNIVRFKDSFETNTHLFLVLEHCANGDLYDLIKFRNNHADKIHRDTEEIRRFMLELIDAVEYIHSKGIYHRDIKPENIFIAESGAAKLGDFGLATKTAYSTELDVGSRLTMAPEQIGNDADGYYPEKADIWAVGIMFLNFVWAKHPWGEPTPADSLFRDFSLNQESLYDSFDFMSEDALKVVRQCLNLNAMQRSLKGAREAVLEARAFVNYDSMFMTAENDQPSDTAELEAAATAGVESKHGSEAQTLPEQLIARLVQSASVAQGPFQWSQAIQSYHADSAKGHIPDDELYAEELFGKSAEEAVYWSSAQHTPSSNSLLDSSLGDSMNSLALFQRDAKANLVAGSLPVDMWMGGSRHAKSFGLGRVAAKSWSEQVEEEEEEQYHRQAQTLHTLNARTYSNGSNVGEGPAQPIAAQTVHQIEHGDKTATTSSDDNDEIFEFEPDKNKDEMAASQKTATASAVTVQPQDTLSSRFRFFMGRSANVPQHAEQPQPQQQNRGNRVSPTRGLFRPSMPEKDNKGAMDKWTELGNRRRATIASNAEKPQMPSTTSMPTVSAVVPQWRQPRAVVGCTPLAGTHGNNRKESQANGGGDNNNMYSKHYPANKDRTKYSHYNQFHGARGMNENWRANKENGVKSAITQFG